MRLIATFQNEPEARRFSAYLKNQQIENVAEMSFDPKTGHMSYAVWAYNEDQIAPAIQALDELKQNSAWTEPPILEQASQGEKPLPRSFKGPTRTTQFFLFLCIAIFGYNAIQELSLEKKRIDPKVFQITPVQEWLLYDLPTPLKSLQEFLEKANPSSKELEQLQTVPFWQGVYPWVVAKVQEKETASLEGPLFTSIRQNQWWRLFSPAVLHQGFLHLLFNMIWLWVLSRPIEERIGSFKTLFLTLVLGIVSNTFQYLMSGPFFLGYSGIILGLAGFTWSREKVAPWEGYPLNRSTSLFLLFFVLAMCALQLGAFFLSLFTSMQFSPNIANTAHITGALAGAILGRLSFFSWKVRKT